MSTLYQHLVDGTGPFDPKGVERLVATPEILTLLRDLVALPWAEYDDEERVDENDAPFFAMLLLGILRDRESLPLIRAAHEHALEQDWTYVTDTAPAVIAAIGPDALPDLLAELEQMERETNLDVAAIDRDELDDMPLYRYWSRVIIVEQIALNHPETRPEVVRFAAARIADRRFDRPHDERPDPDVELEDEDTIFALPTVGEIWADLQLSLHEPELTAIVEEFFERQGDGFVSPLFGTREEYGEVFADGPPESNARERIIGIYDGLRESYGGDAGDWEEEEAEGEDDDEEEEEEEYEAIETYRRPEPKVGRNDPCPCGSGKKYKKCHGAA